MIIINQPLILSSQNVFGVVVTVDTDVAAAQAMLGSGNAKGLNRKKRKAPSPQHGLFKIVKLVMERKALATNHGMFGCTLWSNQITVLTSN